MNQGKTIFAQLMQYIPHNEFHKCVKRHKGEHKVKSFSCWDQFLSMAFAQLSSRESLRDIEACLKAEGQRLYHMGLRTAPSRNTLSNANAVRPWLIWQELGLWLAKEARRLCAKEPLEVELGQSLYALDATVIDLCLSLFPWAKFRKTKAAVKMHTLLDLRGSIPSVVIITPACVHEVNTLDQMPFEPGAFYMVDRGYLDFSRLYRINLSGAFFVTRAKSNTALRRVYSHKVPDKTSGVQCDQSVALCNFYARKDYPAHLRRIRCLDPDSGERCVLLSNNFSQGAEIIATLYRLRWRVELFFRWIKQNLRIKSFLGTSENAVKTQIWIALSVYMLVAILKKRLVLPQSLYTIVQVLSVRLFEKTPILEVLRSENRTNQEDVSSKQLVLFD